MLETLGPIVLSIVAAIVLFCVSKWCEKGFPPWIRIGLLLVVASAALLLAAGAFVALVRGEKKETVEIEMHDLSGEWVPVITVHGYFGNRDAAEDVIRGLQMVSKNDGTLVRAYRISPE